MEINANVNNLAASAVHLKPKKAKRFRPAG